MQEQDYILAFQKGSFDAFGNLYELYVDAIYAFILRKTGERELAEDLCSQVWMKAMKALERFETQEGASFKSWIYRIAQNTIIDYYRAKKEQVDIDEIAEIGFHENIAELIDNKDRLKQVELFLETLKPLEREIVILRVWDDLSYKEIAEITGKTQDNCKQIYKRSLEKIQANVTLLLLFMFFF